MDRVLVVVGVVLVMVGLAAVVFTLGNLVEFLRMRALERRGIEGEAVSVVQDWMNHKYRVHYRVCLPEGGRDERFYEVGVEEPEPLGTVFPVVYDRKKPSRAKLGTRQNIDFATEGLIVKLAWGIGVPAIALGSLLIRFFDS
ncbi:MULTISPECIES: DUF3592 domain-containing protein [Streptomyces]|uniref:DUF3592 domain-containing protein n=1 Tax=Streptomyces TaxID=1883 RepID=UPI000AB8875F|nr:DUF3592 domain-containing protein [Streptomyces katrae]